MVSLSDLGDLHVLGYEVLPLVQQVPPDEILLLYWSASWTTGSGGRREEERGGRGKEEGGGKERMREMGKLGGREGKRLRDGREEEERVRRKGGRSEVESLFTYIVATLLGNSGQSVPSFALSSTHCLVDSNN